MIVQCCMCHKVKTAGEWTRQHVPKSALISSSYCPRCYEQAERELLHEMHQLQTRFRPIVAVSS